MTIARQVGARVAALRNAAGHSQTELARRTGLSQRQIGRIESGEANPTLGTVQLLAEALGVDLVSLLPPPAATADARLAELVQEVQILTERDLRVLTALVRSFTARGISPAALLEDLVRELPK